MAGFVLSIDAGGTSVRFRLSVLQEGRLRPVAGASRPSSGWEVFREDLGLFLGDPAVVRALGESGAGFSGVASFALAGVVDGPALRGSVTRWGSDRFEDLAALASRHGFRCAAALNDLEAAGIAIQGCPEESLAPLDGGGAPGRRKFVNVMPGTGLGVGICLDGRALASEAGSAPCAFDLEDADEIIVCKGARESAGDALPTYETFLCGDGLRLLARTLSGVEAAPEAITDSFSHAGRFRREVTLYVRLLARAAQSAALAALPEACFLSGAIARALPDSVWGGFLVEFRRHAVQGPFLRNVRVARVDVDDLPLCGAESAVARHSEELK